MEVPLRLHHTVFVPFKDEKTKKRRQIVSSRFPRKGETPQTPAGGELLLLKVNKDFCSFSPEVRKHIMDAAAETPPQLTPHRPPTPQFLQNVS